MTGRVGATCLVVLATVTSVAWAASSTSGAACASPTVEPVPAQATPGSPITVNGQFWGDACNDVGPDPNIGNPVHDIEVFLTDGAGQEHSLGVIDAGADYAFALAAAVPEDAAVGAGEVHTTYVPGGFEISAPFAVLGDEVIPDDVIPASPSFTG